MQTRFGLWSWIACGLSVVEPQLQAVCVLSVIIFQGLMT
jgi:hypothetical protein